MKTSRTWIALVVLIAVLGFAANVAAADRKNEPAVAAAVDAPVNINTAGVKQLMTLEGIGQKVAERIVEYRTAHGPFKKPDEIRKVQGVGASLWERNRERIVVK
jgi:competence protein ComEA